jgi:hypothetical protein
VADLSGYAPRSHPCTCILKRTEGIKAPKRTTRPERPLVIPAGCGGHVGARADDDPGTSPGAVDLSGTYSYNDHQSGRPAHGTIGDRTPAGLATYPATFTMTRTKDGVWQWHQEGSRRTTTAAATRCLATASP